MPVRQPLTAHVIGRFYRSWFWDKEAGRKNKKRGLRRSAKRERQKAKGEIRDNTGE